MKAAPAVRSIRSRLLRAVTFWAVVWCCALSLAVWLVVREETRELLDDTLQAAADVLAGPLLGTAPPPVSTVQDAALAIEARPGAADHRFIWQQISYAGPAQVVRRSVGAPPEALQATPTPGYSDVQGWRVYGLALGRDAQLVYVAQSTAERREALAEVGVAMLLACLPMGALGLLWLRVRMRQELAPLQALSLRLAEHDPLLPGATLGPAGHTELEPVHQAIDALAGRLAQRVAQERAFSAHAAHALRTPLAGIDAQLAVALREAPPPAQARLQRVREAASRLERVVLGLLTLFRSSAALKPAPLDLQALLHRLAPDGLTVKMQVTHLVNGDADLLTAALLNLLDNARRYGAQEVVVSTPGPGLLHLQDDGPGADAQRRQGWQQALDSQDYDGRTGLGLMLADLVARAHGGRLYLPPSVSGFAVELRLTAATVG